MLVAACLLTALIFGVNHVPQAKIRKLLPRNFSHYFGDKVLHLAAYGLLGWVYFAAIAKRGRRKSWLAVLLFLTALAAVDELTQPFAGRACELGDWLADTGGVVLAGAVWTRIRATGYARSVAASARALAQEDSV